MVNESIKGQVGNTLSFFEIFEEKREVKDMTEKEVRQHLEGLRMWLGWLPVDMIYWGAKIGANIRIMERSGEPKAGHYVGFECVITTHKIDNYQRVYDPLRKKYFIEKQTSRIPASNIVDFAFIESEVEDESS